MQPIATNGVAWSDCVSVCWSRSWAMFSLFANGETSRVNSLRGMFEVRMSRGIFYTHLVNVRQLVHRRTNGRVVHRVWYACFTRIYTIIIHLASRLKQIGLLSRLSGTSNFWIFIFRDRVYPPTAYTGRFMQ